jgi:hypothetical protein
VFVEGGDMTRRDRLDGLVGKLLPWELNRFHATAEGGAQEQTAIKAAIELAERVMAAVDKRVGIA